MKTIFISAFLQCVYFYSFCQSYEYTPIAFDSLHFVSIRNAIQERFDQDSSQLLNRKKHQSNLLSNYQQRRNYLVSGIDLGYYLYDPEIDRYFQNILKEIFKNNPSIPASEVRLLWSKSFSPNAASFGEGSITLHIGLTAKLENESQLAFIICHEIAHYLLNHSNKSMEDELDQLNTKEVLAKVKRIQNQKYGHQHCQ